MTSATNDVKIRVSCDLMISAHPLDVIPSARSSYYCNNVYMYEGLDGGCLVFSNQ